MGSPTEGGVRPSAPQSEVSGTRALISAVVAPVPGLFHLGPRGSATLAFSKEFHLLLSPFGLVPPSFRR